MLKNHQLLANIILLSLCALAASSALAQQTISDEGTTQSQTAAQHLLQMSKAIEREMTGAGRHAHVLC